MNFLANGSALQSTSYAMLTTPSDIFSPSGVRQSTPQSATILTTPPVFAGITSAVPKVDGSITVGWGSFSSVNNPVMFQVYILLGSVSAGTLFSSAPVAILDESKNSFDIFRLADQVTYLVKGQVYTMGVRCVDGVKNQNTNLVIMTATAIGTANIAGVFQSLLDSLATTDQDLKDDHVNFVSVKNDLEAQVTAISAQIVSLTASALSIDASGDSIASSALTIASSASGLATSASSLANSASILDSETDALAGLLITLATNLTTLSNEVSQLDGVSTEIATATSSIEASATSIRNSANLLISLA
jgi:methyl-accepting chemotaxis protein